MTAHNAYAALGLLKEAAAAANKAAKSSLETERERWSLTARSKAREAIRILGGVA